MRKFLLLSLAFAIFSFGHIFANPLPIPLIMEFSVNPPWIEVFIWDLYHGVLGDTIRTLEGEAEILCTEFSACVVVLDSTNTTGFVLNPQGDSIIFSTPSWRNSIGYGIYGESAGSPPSGTSKIGGVYLVGPDSLSDYRLGYDFCLAPTPGDANIVYTAANIWGTSNLLINEVCMNMTWPEQGNYIELYNSGSSPISTDNYCLIGNSVYYFPEGLIIQPDEYFIIDENDFPEGFDLDPACDVLYLAYLYSSVSSIYAAVDQVGWSANHGENVSFIRYPDGDVNFDVREDFMGYNDETSYTFEDGFPTPGSFNRRNEIDYAYLLGDVNMFVGIWPPLVIGADVTYLVSYFKSEPFAQGCLLDGFWASADINGDCVVIGSDVVRLVNYFRGNGQLDYCPDYDPLWLTQGELPIDSPVGWPNCEMPISGTSGQAALRR